MAMRARRFPYLVVVTEYVVRPSTRRQHRLLGFDHLPCPGSGPLSVQHAEVVGHVEFVPIPVIGRPLLALQVDLPYGEPRPVRREFVEHRPHRPEQTVYVRMAPVVEMDQPVVLAQVLVTVLGTLQHRVGAVFGILHGEVAGVQPEPVDPSAEPEPERVEHGFLQCRVPPVQVGLAGQEAVQVVLAGVVVIRPGRAAEHRDPVVGLGSVGRRVPPYIPVALGVVTGRTRLHKPGVRGRGMVGNPVDDHPKAELMCPPYQGVEVVEAAEDRVHIHVVGHVVSEVGHRRPVEG